MSDTNTPDSIQRLLRLKRYEQPPEGYYDDFLRDFHRRQRAELLKPSLTTLLLERLSYWVSEFRVPTFAYAGATAVAIVASVAILRVTPPPNESQANSSSSYAQGYSQNSFSQTPVTIQKMQPVSLRTGLTGSADTSHLFPTSYQLQARPASHESPLSF